MPTLYPNGLDTIADLPNVTDIAVATKTTATVSITDNIISVSSTAGYAPQNGLIVIDSEQITYTYTTNTQFIGCQRGFAGTSVVQHNINSTVNAFVTAALYTNLRDAVLQIEQFLGINGVNVAIVDQTNSFAGSQQLANGLLLNTQANTGEDQWTIAPTNDGSDAILNFIYVGNAAGNRINIPALVINPHNVAFINTVVSSPNPIFDFSVSPNQIITLTSDITPTFVGLVAGQNITFQFVQDSVGGHVVNWPGTVGNPGQVNSFANSRSIQSFFVYSSSGFDAASPMMYV